MLKKILAAAGLLILISPMLYFNFVRKPELLEAARKRVYEHCKTVDCGQVEGHVVECFDAKWKNAPGSKQNTHVGLGTWSFLECLNSHSDKPEKIFIPSDARAFEGE